MNEVLQLIVACLAFYGAALSTFIFFEKHLRKVNVEISYNIISGTRTEQITLTATNTGMRPVTLNLCAIFVANIDKQIVIPPKPGTNCDNPLPLELKDGEKHTAFLPAKDVAEVLKREMGATGKQRIWGVYKSSVKKKYSSKKIEFHIEHWL